jgi:hypothetical protein
MGHARGLDQTLGRTDGTVSFTNDSAGRTRRQGSTDYGAVNVNKNPVTFQVRKVYCMKLSEVLVILVLLRTDRCVVLRIIDSQYLRLQMS